MSNKERLDILLVNRGLFESREKQKLLLWLVKSLWIQHESIRSVQRFL